MVERDLEAWEIRGGHGGRVTGKSKMSVTVVTLGVNDMMEGIGCARSSPREGGGGEGNPKAQVRILASKS